MHGNHTRVLPHPASLPTNHIPWRRNQVRSPASDQWKFDRFKDVPSSTFILYCSVFRLVPEITVEYNKGMIAIPATIPSAYIPHREPSQMSYCQWFHTHVVPLRSALAFIIHHWDQSQDKSLWFCHEHEWDERNCWIYLTTEPTSVAVNEILHLLCGADKWSIPLWGLGHFLSLSHTRLLFDFTESEQTHRSAFHPDISPRNGNMQGGRTIICELTSESRSNCLTSHYEKHKPRIIIYDWQVQGPKSGLYPSKSPKNLRRLQVLKNLQHNRSTVVKNDSGLFSGDSEIRRNP